MEVTRQWIQRGVSGGTLPPARCADGSFDCPYATPPEDPGPVECSLLRQSVSAGMKPPCSANDWLFEGLRIKIIY